MARSLTGEETALLVRLQRGVPLVRRPFEAVGLEIGMSEARVLELAAAFLADGQARRFGAIFDARRLGYRSVLCAATVSSDRIDDLAARLIPETGITHCYLRAWPSELAPGSPGSFSGTRTPNLWFTLAVQADLFDGELDRIRSGFAPLELLVLPAVRRFKIDVVFDPRHLDRSETFPGAPGYQPPADPPGGASTGLDQEDQTIVRRLQDSLPLTAEPFAAAARILGLHGNALLDRLRAWQAAGRLRRVALVVSHRRVGFNANGMCVWTVSGDRIAEKGRALAARPEITHCYERLSVPAFPYNLYAMIHADAWSRTQEQFVAVSRAAGLTGGRLLCSLREYKKTSMRYFEP